MNEDIITGADLKQAVQEIKQEIERGSKAAYSFWTGILLGVAIGIALLHWF